MTPLHNSPPAERSHNPISLTPEQLLKYRNDGFLIIPDALSRLAHDPAKE